VRCLSLSKIGFIPSTGGEIFNTRWVAKCGLLLGALCFLNRNNLVFLSPLFNSLLLRPKSFEFNTWIGGFRAFFWRLQMGAP
jgi:hypothetical protein